MTSNRIPFDDLGIFTLLSRSMAMRPLGRDAFDADDAPRDLAPNETAPPDPPTPSPFILDRRPAMSPELAAIGVWLRLGFVGASTLLIALTMLVNGEARFLPALAAASAGGAFAAFAWRRSWRIVNRVDALTDDAAAPQPLRDPSEPGHALG